MNIAVLLAKLQFKITPEERKQFRHEQQCSIKFASLPVVRRLFNRGNSLVDVLVVVLSLYLFARCALLALHAMGLA